MAQVNVRECDFTVEKNVTCEDPATDPLLSDNTMALPGSMAWFVVDIENTGDTDLTSLTINDVLGCSTWYVGSSVSASIGATNVTSCICNVGAGGVCETLGEVNGTKNLAPCKANGIATGESLRLTFKVLVPANFAVVGQSPDCTNTITIGSGADICAAPGSSPCPQRTDLATIDVKVPDLVCNKAVCVDSDSDGNCNSPFSSNLEIEQCLFPMSLKYQFTVNNLGETPLTDVKFCDPALAEDLMQAGVLNIDCVIDAAGCIALPDVSVGGSESVVCTFLFGSGDEWDTFEGLNGADDDCYTNVGTMSAAPTLPDDTCAPVEVVRVSETCAARVCCGEEECPEYCLQYCEPTTKANFDIWNQNEDFFSGTHRCVTLWDQELLSNYVQPNHVWLSTLGTNSGKARIDGHESPDVCPDSVEAPLIGVEVKSVRFNGKTELAGTTLVGQGYEPGQFKYEVPDGPPEPLVDGGQPQDGDTGTEGYSEAKKAGLIPPSPEWPDLVGAVANGKTPRTSVSTKGSLLVFPDVEVKWNSDGELIQDTYIMMVNDYIQDVRVKLYLVNGDCCCFVDNEITLTLNEPTYWAVSNGQPKGLSAFSNTGPAREDDDLTNPGGRRMRGYLIAWAIDRPSHKEISWNHLTGHASIVHFGDMAAWEYGAWAFAAVASNNVATANPGDLLLPPYGQLDLDGVEYASTPDLLLFNFYSAGATLSSGGLSTVEIDTELTLMPMLKDLRRTIPDDEKPSP